MPHAAAPHRQVSICVIIGNEARQHAKSRAMLTSSLEGRPGWRKTITMSVHVHQEPDYDVVVYEKDA